MLVSSRKPMRSLRTNLPVRIKILVSQRTSPNCRLDAGSTLIHELAGIQNTIRVQGPLYG